MSFIVISLHREALNRLRVRLNIYLVSHSDVIIGQHALRSVTTVLHWTRTPADAPALMVGPVLTVQVTLSQDAR